MNKKGFFWIFSPSWWKRRRVRKEQNALSEFRKALKTEKKEIAALESYLNQMEYLLRGSSPNFTEAERILKEDVLPLLKKKRLAQAIEKMEEKTIQKSMFKIIQKQLK